MIWQQAEMIWQQAGSILSSKKESPKSKEPQLPDLSVDLSKVFANPPVEIYAQSIYAISQRLAQMR